MEVISQTIKENKDTPTGSLATFTRNDNYGDVLKKFGVKYIRTDYYLEVGEPLWKHGWLLEISVIVSQIPDLLTLVIPILIREKVAFKIARSTRKATSILGGELGWLLLGKVLCIYPADISQAINLALVLINNTKAFKGPQIVTDRQLGGVVYARYGTGKTFTHSSKSDIDKTSIYDTKPELEKDFQTIPFQLPEGIDWPFASIATLNPPKCETVLQDRYKPMYLLKEDAKGTVRKGLWLKKIYHIKWCVIKEGRQNMASDSDGRDIFDRLHWQCELHKDLENIVPIPKIYDFFEENGNGYIVMENIQGVSLNSWIETVFQGRTWLDLDLAERMALLDYALKILDIIENMHSHGYIHRDITSNNFLANKKGQLWMIDLELSYSVSHKKPYPPFRLGTPGFMSPEQEATLEPSIEQDIFAIGAVLVELLTGLVPNYYTQNNIVSKQQLGFFIYQPELVDLIGSCFDPRPNLRPDISRLRIALQAFKSSQKPIPDKIIIVRPDEKELKEFITKALQGISTPVMFHDNNLWVSRSSNGDGSDSRTIRPVAICEDLFEGQSGIIWLLSKAKEKGFSIDCCTMAYKKGITFIENIVQHGTSSLEGGLYAGAAGIAVALIAGIKNELIPNKEETLGQIKVLLQNKNIQGYGIVKGLAGQGIALLRCSSMLTETFTKPLLNEKIEQFLEKQQDDGSWISETDKNKKLLKFTGFGHGVAGISCFLLCYLLQYKDDLRVKTATLKAMEWLVKQAFKRKGKIQWPIHHNTKQYALDFQNGRMGIILCLIKAYEVFKDTRYKELAEECLRIYPKYTITQDLTLLSGLAGHGEILLEAVRVFKDREWEERIDWIVQLLLHNFQQEKSGERYWITDGSLFPTAGLLQGNSGVIHFLLRYYQPENLRHPLLGY